MRSLTVQDSLEQTLRVEYRQVRASAAYGGGSHVYLQRDMRTLSVLMERQLLNTASAFLFGFYKERQAKTAEERQDLVIHAFQTTLWNVIILSLSRGWDYEKLNWASLLSHGLHHLKASVGNQYAIATLVSRCGKILEDLAALPKASSYRVVSLMRELVYSLGCLGGALGVTEKRLIAELQREQSHKSTADQQKRREQAERTVAEIHDVCERLFAGQHQPILKFVGLNEAGTLGQLCVTMGRRGIDLIRSTSQTITLDGRSAMHYLAWIRLPMATRAMDVISELNDDQNVRDVLLSEPEICLEDANEQEWTVHSRGFSDTDACYCVYIDGAQQVKSAVEVDRLRAEQKMTGTYALFFDGPESCYWVYRDPYETTSGDELALVNYLAKAGKGFRCRREMAEQGFNLTNPAETFGRCPEGLKAVVEPVLSDEKPRTKGWRVTGPTCCILLPNNP